MTDPASVPGRERDALIQTQTKPLNCAKPLIVAGELLRKTQDYLSLPFGLNLAAGP
jgi:hypothetical protein